MKFDGNKTRFGLVLSSLSVLFAQVALVFDGKADTNADASIVMPALLVLWGAAHAICKDWQAARVKRHPAPGSEE